MMERFSLKKIQFLNSFHLKMIAIITMVIDHTGVIFFPGNLIFRDIGRISFPIFCFLLVEGFVHTKNLKKYVARMAVFSLLSEIPYDLAFHGVVFETEKQNVFFTLTLGLIMLYAIKSTRVIVEKVSILIIVFWLAAILSADYGFKGLLLILVYYLFREQRFLAALAGASWNHLWNKVFFVQKYGAIASIPVLLYNGLQGKKVKYIFYIFYPAHLIILYTLRRYI